MKRKVAFLAQWDDEAKVWWAQCRTDDGIVTEAATVEALRQRLKLIVPDFFEAGDASTDDFEIELNVRYVDMVAAE